LFAVIVMQNRTTSRGRSPRNIKQEHEGNCKRNLGDEAVR
jgi:hypothetical protein